MSGYSQRIKNKLEDPEFLKDYDEDYYKEEAMSGFSHHELQAAFSFVKDKENWKNEIRARIPSEDLRITDIAVGFICGSRLEVVEEDDDTCLVYGPGYYVCIGS
jgi:hypothetical protein